VPLLLLGSPFFPNYSFCVHHLVNRDDRHLLANAIMASGFRVTSQLSQREQLFFSLWIQLHGLIRMFRNLQCPT
jgi:hypothetical protein